MNVEGVGTPAQRSYVPLASGSRWKPVPSSCPCSTPRTWPRSDPRPDESGRLVVFYNPMMAQQRVGKREQLLAATERELEQVARRVQAGACVPLRWFGLQESESGGAGLPALQAEGFEGEAHLPPPGAAGEGPPASVRAGLKYGEPWMLLFADEAPPQRPDAVAPAPHSDEA